MQYPDTNLLPINPPEKFGDFWEEELSLEEKKIVKNYLNKISEISKKNNFSIKVGRNIISSNYVEKNFKKNSSLILHAPRKSLVRAVRSNIFDDLLIGNFAKLIIPYNRINFRKILSIPSKYIDNIGIKNGDELKQFLWTYRNSYDDKFVQVKSELILSSRDIITTKFLGNTKFLSFLKSIYQKL